MAQAPMTLPADLAAEQERLMREQLAAQLEVQRVDRWRQFAGKDSMLFEPLAGGMTDEANARIGNANIDMAKLQQKAQAIQDQGMKETALAVWQEYGLTAAEMKAGIAAGGFRDPMKFLQERGRGMQEVAKGSVEAQTGGSKVEQASAEVAFTKARTVTESAQQANYYANIAKTKAETAKAWIDAQRAAQPKEGDWITEKLPNGSTRQVQMGKVPDGAFYAKNPDGTMSMMFDISKTDGANKSAFEAVDGISQAINKRQAQVSILTGLAPKFMGREISDAAVWAAEKRASIGMASADDRDILSYNASLKALATMDIKSLMGGNTSDAELRAVTEAYGSITSPSTRRDMLASNTLAAQKVDQKRLEIFNTAIRSGVSPAQAKMAADTATKGEVLVEGLRSLLKTGKTASIRAQYSAIRNSGLSAESVMAKLGQDANLLRNYQ